MINETSSVFLLTSKKNQYKIYRLNCDGTVKSIFVNIFNSPLKDELVEYEEIRFQLGYELNNDEIWKIDNFNIPQEICSALEYPDTIDLYSPADKTGLTVDGYSIKCLFMGEIVENKPRIVFQRFEQSQIFKRKRPSIIYKNNIFTQNNDFCLNLLERPDAVYYDGTFKFINYTNANKVLPLGNYYREATQEEVDSFKAASTFAFEDESAFDKYAVAHNVRGQIAKILDSKVLEEHSAEDLKRKAHEYSIEINVQDNKIIMPTTKKEIKYFLVFLSEKIYKGPLSGKTLISSSTREKEE